MLAAKPSASDLASVMLSFERFLRIAAEGIAAIERTIDGVRCEEQLIRAQAEVAFFARCVRWSVCPADALPRLQRRFTTAASALIVDVAIPVTFESDLLADWVTSAGSDPGVDVERRICRNSLPNIAAKDPRDSPSAVIEFDEPGAEFVGWLRRFMATVRRNWSIPYAAMSRRGHVRVTLDDSSLDLRVVGPCQDLAVDLYCRAIWLL